MTNQTEIRAHVCRGDFWLRLEEAMEQAGGSIPLDRLAEMKLKDVVDILAQNGIRMVHEDKWHIRC